MGNYDLLFKYLKDEFFAAVSVENRFFESYKENNEYSTAQLNRVVLHLFQAYDSDNKWNVEELNNAIMLCKMAHFASLMAHVEGFVFVCKTYIYSFKGKEDIITFLPEYNEWIINVDQTNNYVSSLDKFLRLKMIENDFSDNAEITEHITILEQHLCRLSGYIAGFKNAEQHMGALNEIRKEASKKEWYFRLFSDIAIALISVVLGAALGVLISKR